MALRSKGLLSAALLLAPAPASAAGPRQDAGQDEVPEAVGPPVAEEEFISVQRCPGDGSQPRIVVDAQGTLHLLYFRGAPEAGDLFYARSTTGGETFSDPIRVNAAEGAVDAREGVRGGTLSMGRDGRVLVAWVGSEKAEPRGPGGETPLLFTRKAEGEDAFEPARNLIETHFGLEAAPAIAAEEAGSVHVFWHAPQEEGDPHRRIWIRSSTDDGASFSEERAIDDERTGASETCNLTASFDTDGTLYVLYRSFNKKNRRPMRLLYSIDGGRRFDTTFVDFWMRLRCPKSLALLRPGAVALMAAWETDGEVLFAPVDKAQKKVSLPMMPGEVDPELYRSRPSLATNERHATLLVWMEGPRGGEPARLMWRGFDNRSRRPFARGSVEDVSEDTVPEVFVRPDNGFTILY